MESKSGLNVVTKAAVIDTVLNKKLNKIDNPKTENKIMYLKLLLILVGNKFLTIFSEIPESLIIITGTEAKI